MGSALLGPEHYRTGRGDGYWLLCSLLSEKSCAVRASGCSHNSCSCCDSLGRRLYHLSANRLLSRGIRYLPGYLDRCACLNLSHRCLGRSVVHRTAQTFPWTRQPALRRPLHDRAGVAQVLSQAQASPCSRAICATAAMPVILSRGLDGVSTRMSLVAGVGRCRCRSCPRRKHGGHSGQPLPQQAVGAVVEVLRDDYVDPG